MYFLEVYFLADFSKSNKPTQKETKYGMSACTIGSFAHLGKETNSFL